MRRPLSSKQSVISTYDEISFTALPGPSPPSKRPGIDVQGGFASTGDIAFLFDPQSTPMMNSGGASRIHTHTLAQIEDDLSTWCLTNGEIRPIHVTSNT